MSRRKRYKDENGEYIYYDIDTYRRYRRDDEGIYYEIDDIDTYHRQDGEGLFDVVKKVASKLTGKAVKEIATKAATKAAEKGAEKVGEKTGQLIGEKIYDKFSSGKPIQKNKGDQIRKLLQEHNAKFPMESSKTETSKSEFKSTTSKPSRTSSRELLNQQFQELLKL